MTPWGVGHVRMDAGFVASALSLGDLTYFGSDAHDTSGTSMAWSPRVSWLRTDGDESLFLVGYEIESPRAWYFRVARVADDPAVTFSSPTSTTAGGGPSLTHLNDTEVLYAYEPGNFVANMARRIITVDAITEAVTVGSSASWVDAWQNQASAKPARSHFGGTKVAYVYTFDTYLNIYWRLKTDADNFVADADWWNVHEVASPAKQHYDPQIIDLGTADDGGEDSLITWLGVGSDNVFEFGACGVRLYSNNTQWRGTPSLFNVTLGGSNVGKFWSAKTGDYQVTLFVADLTSTGSPQGIYLITATLDPDDFSITWGTLQTLVMTETWADYPRVATMPDGSGVLAKVVDDDNGFYYGRTLDFNLLTPVAGETIYSFPGQGPPGLPTFDHIFHNPDIAIDPNTGLGLYVAIEEEEFDPSEGDYFAQYGFGVPFRVGA